MTELAADVPAPRSDGDQQNPYGPPYPPLTPGPNQHGQPSSQHGQPEPVADEPEQGLFNRVAGPMVDRLRNNSELAADRGTTVIANEVVEKIAGIAAREVPGVYDLGGDVSRVFSAVKERIGLGHGDGDQGISVRLEGSQAAVKVTLVIEYGFVVYAVTEAVRAKVIGAIEHLLGLDVTTVDIVVDDVHVPDRPADQAVPAQASARQA